MIISHSVMKAPSEDLEISNRRPSLPHDVLFNIFHFTSTYTKTLTIPPVMTDFPWVLTRVCSSWRHVARSMPQLWKASLNFGLDSDSGITWTYPSKESLSDLRRVVTLLPRGTHLKIKAMTHDEVSFAPVPTRAIIPYLPYVNELKWDVHGQTSIKSFPMESLAHIEVLTLRTRSIDPEIDEEDEDMVYYPDFFGESPRLRELTLRSGYPDFLCCGVPLSQLRYLSLDTTDVDPSHDMELSWKEFTLDDPSPFSELTSLQDLTLMSYSPLLFLEFSWPWHQLTTLRIHNMTRDPRNITRILEVIALSTSLRTLEASGLVTLNKNIIPSKTLVSLTIQKISLYDIYTIAVACPELEFLDVEYIPMDAEESAAQDETTATNGHSIVFPRLKTLQLSLPPPLDDFWTPSCFPTLLTLPHLSSLKIEASLGPFPGKQLKDLLLTSQSISEFVYKFPYRSDASLDAESLEALFETLGSCAKVHIEERPFPDKVLDSFAAGVLLPQVRDVTLGAPTCERLLAVIKQRLNLQGDGLASRLERVEGYVPSSEYEHVGKHRKDDTLEKNHGLKMEWSLFSSS